MCGAGRSLPTTYRSGSGSPPEASRAGFRCFRQQLYDRSQDPGLHLIKAMVVFRCYGVTTRRHPSAKATCGLFLPAILMSAGRRISLFKTNCLTVFAISGCVLFSMPAQAQDISCTCRYKGADYGIGETICLKSPDGLRMATCGMVLNNTSWQLSNAPCPFSSLQKATPPKSNATPFPGQAKSTGKTKTRLSFLEMGQAND